MVATQGRPRREPVITKVNNYARGGYIRTCSIRPSPLGSKFHAGVDHPRPVEEGEGARPRHDRAVLRGERARVREGRSPGGLRPPGA
eukprot:4374287-Alexandrium_andersonii.AAC.1